jgi:hypothetical protein
VWLPVAGRRIVLSVGLVGLFFESSSEEKGRRFVFFLISLFSFPRLSPIPHSSSAVAPQAGGDFWRARRRGRGHRGELPCPSSFHLFLCLCGFADRVADRSSTMVCSFLCVFIDLWFVPKCPQMCIGFLTVLAPFCLLFLCIHRSRACPPLSPNVGLVSRSGAHPLFVSVVGGGGGGWGSFSSIYPDVRTGWI